MRKRLLECGPGQSVACQVLRNRGLYLREWYEQSVQWEYRVLHAHWTQLLAMAPSTGVMPAPHWLSDRCFQHTQRVRAQAELEWRQEEARSKNGAGE